MSHAVQKTSACVDALPFREPTVDAALGAKFGVKPDEYEHILKILGRTPTYTELGVFSVMWSEHCSYKSSRIHLKKLPTQAPWVIEGPGENAGVIDIGDGQAAVFKMESHNHPSFIEPYQGAATGVGGIMRDVFTMGARPVANLNALRFGSPDHPKTRALVAGVVAGIAGYGNCMGVPTVGGETNFHSSYNGNILVNAMTVGVVDTDKIYYSRGATPGQPIVYVGSKTGRDGIHGATMASAEFDDKAEAQRPTVQVGDPFTEKLLLEACLELMATDAIVCIQDMGAAGLTSSSVEIAAKGNVGVDLDLDRVPMRETGMSPYEIMLSESQERMLMVLHPDKEAQARAIFEKWDLDFAVIGQTIADRRMVLRMYGRTWCDIPVPPLVDEAPVYDRPQGPYPAPPPFSLSELGSSLRGREIKGQGQDSCLLDALKTLLACPDLASKRWIWEQYDSLVRGDTVFGPGVTRTQTDRAADSALVRLAGGTKALAMTSDVTPRYVQADPFEGGKQAVAESYRNLCAVGARPLAITNNLNFGNPEKPEVMTQFVRALEGIAAACRALDYPVVSGNVSLYNETNGKAIYPTPTIGGVGLLDDWSRAPGLAFKAAGETILLIGGPGRHLGQSLYVREILGLEAGQPPEVDLACEQAHGAAIRQMIARGLLSACHDISDGGLAVALAEMAMAGATGCDVEGPQDEAFWFGEDQARYVLTTADPHSVLSLAQAAGIPSTILGKTADSHLTINGKNIFVSELSALNNSWLPTYMNASKS